MERPTGDATINWYLTAFSAAKARQTLQVRRNCNYVPWLGTMAMSAASLCNVIYHSLLHHSGTVYQITSFANLQLCQGRTSRQPRGSHGARMMGVVVQHAHPQLLLRIQSIGGRETTRKQP